jgi:hypothetical protein
MTQGFKYFPNTSGNLAFSSTLPAICYAVIAGFGLVAH